MLKLSSAPSVAPGKGKVDVETQFRGLASAKLRKLREDTGWVMRGLSFHGYNRGQVHDYGSD